MTIKQVEMNVKTDNGYDALHPKTDSDIVNYNNTASGLKATNVKTAIDELDTDISKLNNQTNVINNTQIQVAEWVDNADKEGFVAYAQVSVSGLLATDQLSVAFADADRTNLVAFDMQVGSFKVYAREKPTATVTIPSIAIVRKVVL